MGDPADVDDARHPARLREVYDDIAEHFDQTREYPWPEVEEFVADCPESHVALDVGSGNGRHSAVLSRTADRVVGLDLSRDLLRQAAIRMDEGGWTADLLQGDAAGLPLADGAIDVAVYVATLHHLPDRETRRHSLDEMARVLAPGGTALVSAWSTAADRFDTETDPETGFDTTVEWTLPGGEVRQRFYHIYAPDEFEADLAASALDVAESFLSSGNCYARVEGKRP
ncbi:class I SAM-dependent methyltransferase [Halobacteriales archaeon Cl-PHB]